jgi:hypothetical protein
MSQEIDITQNYRFNVIYQDLSTNSFSIEGRDVESILKNYTFIGFDGFTFIVTEESPSCVINSEIINQILGKLEDDLYQINLILDYTDEEYPDHLYDSLLILYYAIQRLSVGITSSYVMQCPKTRQYYKIEVNNEMLDNIIAYTNDICESKFPLNTYFQLRFID